MIYDNYNKCFLARVVLEAVTPICTASGRGGVQTDSLINRDANGLPFIPATTLVGLMRHAIGSASDAAKRMMGYLIGRDGHGSFLSVSEAKLVIDSEGRAVDGLNADYELDYIAGFRQMPVRQHVKITHRGVAEDGGKFDEEIVPKGVRFCFEMELRSDERGRDDFDSLLGALNCKSFRVGGGSRKGFGEIKIVSISYRALDFTNSSDLDAYICKSSSLAEIWTGYKSVEIQDTQENDLIHYELKLSPCDFVLFGSGFGDERSDMSVVREPFVRWTNGNPEWQEAEMSLVVPASSVKGAIAHRTAYYYNMLCGCFADDDYRNLETESNPAVESLFGSAKSRDGRAHRGSVLFSDIVRKTASATKVVNHVKIDHFTGSAINGALFAEDPFYAAEEELELHLTLIEKDLDKAVRQHQCDKSMVLRAFELSLQDICRSLLPLGGGVNRGNGCMSGRLFKDGLEVYPKTMIDDECN